MRSRPSSRKTWWEAVRRELASSALAAQSEAATRLAEATRRVKETLGDLALDQDGRLAQPYNDTTVGKDYLLVRERAASYATGTLPEVAVHNHLYTFLSRYYDNGDFISKRRYGRKERYAIPYNGEEVYLHWANSDQ